VRKTLVTDQDESISLRKLLKGAVTGEWRGADVERRALAEGTLSTGGYMLPSLVSSRILDLARNKARVLQAGASIIPMSERTLLVPKWATDQTAAWHTENAAITPSDPSLGSVTLTAHTLASIVVVSRELIEDTGVNFDDQLQLAFAQRFGLVLDLAALYGSGSDPEPRGVKNTAAVVKTPMATNGAAPPNYDFVVDAVGRLADGNEEANAIIYSPRTARELAKLKDTTNQPMEAPEYVGALPRYETNQIGNAFTVGSGTTTSDMFVADWSQLLVGIRTSLQIQVLDQRYSDFGQIGFLAWFRGDVAVGRADPPEGGHLRGRRKSSAAPRR
jgi:HK97 family phage major capsid protein